MNISRFNPDFSSYKLKLSNSKIMLTELNQPNALEFNFEELNKIFQ